MTLLSIVVVIFFSVKALCSTPIDYIRIGTLIVLGLTLIAVIQYAFDTNRMIDLQQRVHLTPQVVHQISAIDLGNNEFDIGFDLVNHSSYYVEATVNVRLESFGVEIRIPDNVYYGARPWVLPPHSNVHGHFKLNDGLLQLANRTMADLRRMSRDENMLTLVIERIQCTIPHGIPLKIPAIRYHFVFDRAQPNGSTWSGWVLDI